MGEGTVTADRDDTEIKNPSFVRIQAAFFDLDKTVIAKPAMVAFALPLYRAGLITKPLIVRAVWTNLWFRLRGADANRMTKYRQTGLRIIRGWDAHQVRTVVSESLTTVLEPTIFREAHDLIRAHQQAGRMVFLVSAEPEEIVVPMGEYLGVDETISSQAELDADGRYTGEGIAWVYGPHKAEAMRAAAQRLDIDLDASYAYSDSATDLPMLEAVGHPVAINPDRELAKVAEARRWQVRRFRLS
jgi:HAD superfamily hydrolase (TIGR01490 family)